MLSPVELIKKLSQPLAPEPTGIEPHLPRLAGIQALVFDIYGTLVVSGSGDIGVTDAEQKGTAMRSILRDFQIEIPDQESLSDRFVELITQDHARSRRNGIEHPEVEIRDIWGTLLGSEDSALLEATATAYECTSNPVWPMPGAEELLATAHRDGLTLGIVSNAQFYTPLLFEAFFGASLARIGFDPDLCFFSYQFKQAKPGDWLYEQLRDALAAREIDPGAVLYVGNDALKDIHPAATLGFRTALFAGDRRSYRPRPEMTALRPPDAVITELGQLSQILG